MIILGIESSCDETACGIVRNGNELLANAVFSSMDLHAQYGGVVPEIAARSHIESITPVIEQALHESGLEWSDIDGIAVTYGAGLGGSLLVGVMAARTLAIIKNKPLYAINHVEGHVYANFLTSTGALDDTALQAPLLSQRSNPTSPSAAHPRLASPESPADVHHWKLGKETYVLPASAPSFPCLALIVSGGHSQLALFRGHFGYTLLGQTQDDAIGEAFDKVAKILGLPYPGGPSVGTKALVGNAHAFDLPKSKLDNKYDYSFSGVKTAVLRRAQAMVGKDFTFPSKLLPEALNDAQKADIAAVFQRVAIETVVDKTIMAYEEFQPVSVVIAGGVAASPELRRQLRERLPIPISYTDPKLCTDNGAMIATLGCFKAMHHQPTADPYSLEINPNLSM